LARVHGEIKALQRQWTGQNRHILGCFKDVPCAESSRDGEANGLVKVGFGLAFEVGNAFGGYALEAKLPEEPRRQSHQS